MNKINSVSDKLKEAQKHLAKVSVWAEEAAEKMRQLEATTAIEDTPAGGHVPPMQIINALHVYLEQIGDDVFSTNANIEDAMRYIETILEAQNEH